MVAVFDSAILPSLPIAYTLYEYDVPAVIFLCEYDVDEAPLSASGTNSPPSLLYSILYDLIPSRESGSDHVRSILSSAPWAASRLRGADGLAP